MIRWVILLSLPCNYSFKTFWVVFVLTWYFPAHTCGIKLYICGIKLYIISIGFSHGAVWDLNTKCEKKTFLFIIRNTQSFFSKQLFWDMWILRWEKCHFHKKAVLILYSDFPVSKLDCMFILAINDLTGRIQQSCFTVNWYKDSLYCIDPS